MHFYERAMKLQVFFTFMLEIRVKKNLTIFEKLKTLRLNNKTKKPIYAASTNN